MTWAEFDYMARGYHRRIHREQTNLGKVLFMIDTTKPRQRGRPAPKLEDYLPDQPEAKPIDIEERKKMAKEAVKRAERFNKGVKKEVYGKRGAH